MWERKQRLIFGDPVKSKLKYKKLKCEIKAILLKNFLFKNWLSI